MPKQGEMTNLWFYLARRDKKAVKIIAVLRGRPQAAVRVTDLSVLNLPQTWESEITNLIYDNRMYWEPFVESSEDFDSLRDSLKKREFSGLPINGQPMFTKSSLAEAPKVNVNHLPTNKKMVRRGGR